MDLTPTDQRHVEVMNRFGLLPNFFRLTQDPQIMTNLWSFARFAYLDNPLPSLFKERLFVYLSRFCEVRYCIARHVGFLIGLGRFRESDRRKDEFLAMLAHELRNPLAAIRNAVQILLRKDVDDRTRPIGVRDPTDK